MVLETSRGRLVIGRRRERALLAVLLLQHGAEVPADRLTYLLWDGEPPPSARQSLRSHVSRLRTVLKDTPLRLDTAGRRYRLHATDAEVDVWQFQRMVAAARTAVDTTERRDVLAAAAELWSGEPLEDTATDWLRARVLGELDELRLTAAEEWLACTLTAGGGAEALARTAALADANPARERLVGLRIRVLHDIGRTGEALHLYERCRAQLADEYGVDPGGELRAVHLAVLRGGASGPVAAAPAALLPLDIAGFAGRGEDLATLDAILEKADAQPTAVMVAAVSGIPGVGKSALAVHWAHSVADRFPDGQLYVNLRGSEPPGQAMEPAEALRRFLDALGLPPVRMPADVGGLSDLYRSSLAGRRVLVVIDNARDADQAGPLLPGAPGCVAVITSRDVLGKLIVDVGAQPLQLGLLPEAEARAVLAGRIGADRLAAEPAAAQTIVDRCAGLALALAVVGARAATHRSLPLAVVAEELAAAFELPAGSSWPKRSLSPAVTQLLRLLTVPGRPPAPQPAGAGRGDRVLPRRRAPAEPVRPA